MRRRSSNKARSRQQLRGLCWVVVALSAMLATQPGTDQGHARIGLALAATLAVATVVTARNDKGRKRK